MVTAMPLFSEDLRRGRCFLVGVFIFRLQRNLALTNLRGPYILFFIARILLLQGLFTMCLTTEALRIKFFIAGTLLLKGSLDQGFSVHPYYLFKPRDVGCCLSPDDVFGMQDGSSDYTLITEPA
jgi:hypothetical protein